MVSPKTVSLLGLAFKPDTDDLRDAPSIDIAKKLAQHGAIVQAHDPVAMERFRAEYGELQIELKERPELVFDRADAVILVTDWNVYRELDWAALRATMRTPLVVDGRSFLDREELEAAGYRLVTIP